MVRQGIQAYRSLVSGLVVSVMLTGCFMNAPVEPSAVNNAPPPTGGNGAPEITGNPPRVVKVGVVYSFTPQATDPDADPLTFSINNQPTWVDFNSSNGSISGVPLLGNEGTYNDVEISVSDGQMSTTLPPFSISVEPNTAPNMPPEIDGIPPASVTVGDIYTFTPTGSDPDGDLLTYSILNRPGWANFSSSTGQLSGTPQAGDERMYTDIAITVSDSVSTASLPAFAITVNQISLGSATLSWIPPTQNTDGSPLMDLAGFKLYYGTMPGNYPNQITINNPGITTYVVDNLAPNTWYFVSTSFNSSGMESEYSVVASKTIN